MIIKNALSFRFSPQFSFLDEKITIRTDDNGHFCVVLPLLEGLSASSETQYNTFQGWWIGCLEENEWESNRKGKFCRLNCFLIVLTADNDGVAIPSFAHFFSLSADTHISFSLLTFLCSSYSDIFVPVALLPSSFLPTDSILDVSTSPVKHDNLSAQMKNNTKPDWEHWRSHPSIYKTATTSQILNEGSCYSWWSVCRIYGEISHRGPWRGSIICCYEWHKHRCQYGFCYLP